MKINSKDLYKREYYKIAMAKKKSKFRNLITKWYITTPLFFILISIILFLLGASEIGYFNGYLVFPLGLLMFFGLTSILSIDIFLWTWVIFYYLGLGALIVFIHKRKSIILFIIALIIIILTFVGCTEHGITELTQSQAIIQSTLT